MSNDDVIIHSFAIGGYRSFGRIQRFESLSKINLFIGQNNSGKSNILKFINDIYPNLTNKNLKLAPLDKHFPSSPNFITGIPISLEQDDKGNYQIFHDYIFPKFKGTFGSTQRPGYLLSVFKELARISNTKNAWFDFDQNMQLLTGDWEKAFACLSNDEIYQLWTALTQYTSGGSRDKDWFPSVLNAITPKFKAIKSVMIPAIREVGLQGSVSEGFSGEGLIERLVKLQNPDVHNQADRRVFEKINKFLQSVTDNQTARIEIPHERNTILVHMDGKTLPLESLGTGIHEVIIIASASTILEDTVVCMEEPELHLNPILQKKLIRYLAKSTKNQYFISTHSAALMDTPTAEIYHIHQQNGESIAVRVTSDKQRSSICEDLGYRPSDLLQANCVIWVEGPSDRNYINFWINAKASKFVEGVHYSIMFYGGRLLSHLTGEDAEDNELIDNFISLRRLNRRGVIVIDSDRAKKGAQINDTKKRLKAEFDKGPGYAWITDGREIENYLPSDQIAKAIQSTKPSAQGMSKFGRYDNCLTIKNKNGKISQASKVSVAKYVTENFVPDETSLNLAIHLNKLVKFISESNPAIHMN